MRVGIISFVISMIIVGWLATDTAFTRGQNREYSESELHEVEQEYRVQLREILEGKGYENCGITMTYVKEYMQPKEYSIVIHHERIENLSKEQKENLMIELQEIKSGLEEYEIYHKFL